MICNKCGTKIIITPDGYFCPKCGVIIVTICGDREKSIYEF